MTAISRGGAVLVAAALAVAPAAALAQASPTPTTSNSTQPTTVGPSELQNFNLRGTVTRPADQSSPVPAPQRSAPVQNATQAPAPVPRRTVQSPSARRIAPPVTTPAPAITAAPQAPVRQSPAGSTTIALPPIAATPAPAPSASAPVTGVAVPAPDQPFAPSRNLVLWPWLAAALALAGGAAFLFWRRRPSEALAGGGQFDLLVPAAPEPELRRAPQRVAPKPAPVPPQAVMPKPARSGIVASRLRPALEIAFQPLRCQIDDDQVTIEFELELFNAGAAPARAVLAEASLLNASATQDQELAAFFANPQGVGDRLDLIPPMKRVSFKNQVVVPRSAVQEYELAGRRTFVPVIAFNALYEWSGGRAQSSAAYLVGRDTQREKLGPLRLDQGAREYRGLGARSLPAAVRT